MSAKPERAAAAASGAPPLSKVTPFERPARHDTRLRPHGLRGWIESRRRSVGAVAALLAIGLVAIVVVRSFSRPAPIAVAAPTQTINTTTVRTGPIDRTLVITGSLAAWDELPIGAEAGGLAITEVKVEQGDRVAKGQVLARLDGSVLRAQLAQADASIAQAEAGLQKAEASAAAAASDVRRAKELIKNGYISGQLAEQRETVLATALADVNVARQTLATNKATRDQRFAQLQQAEILAPTDGVVSKRTATLGNVVATGQELFRLIRDGRVELQAEVTEIDLARLREGQPVAVALEGDAARRFDGSIRMLGATVDPRTRMGIVYVTLPADSLLKPGMFVRGIVTTGASDAVQAPEEALVFKDGKPAIFVVGADNRARLRQIETGARQNGMVEIVSGVAAGDRVALAGAGYLKDNDLVRIESVAPIPAAAAQGETAR